MARHSTLLVIIVIIVLIILIIFIILIILIILMALLPGETTDDVLDVSRRAEVSTMDDYDNVPIEQYGLAMLRGMGWKPGILEEPCGHAVVMVW